MNKKNLNLFQRGYTVMSGKNMENPDTANIRKEMEAVLSAKR